MVLQPRRNRDRRIGGVRCRRTAADHQRRDQLLEQPHRLQRDVRRAGSATSKVQIANGAQINALQQNSYFAIVAPRIEQGGKVRVNGRAAYAAGEQLTMTMNQGLFDIVVDVGTARCERCRPHRRNERPSQHECGRQSQYLHGRRAKNQAMTMLLGGKVGFDDATSATVENGSVVLGAGYNVQGGALTENTAGSTL